ncbi:MAG: helix-turn-helix transcriptional regulator [Actinobacteria bacterium]|nr:helix-turn-helix transcriptional regulator [Actinomycetota bacterium]
MATATSEGRKDQRTKSAVAAAIAHPVRTYCLAILCERTASPAEIARRSRYDVNMVAYHVRTLKKWGLIEQVDERQVRGATEHLYRAVKRAELTDEEERTLPDPERRQYAETILSFFNVDAVQSIDAGLLYQRTDHFMTRYAYDIDEKGWEDTRDAYRECFEKVKLIEEETSARLEQDERGEDEKPQRIVSFLGMFEIPPLGR